MNEVHQRLKQWLSESVELMQKNYNKRRKIMEPLEKGELVLLNGRNIRTKHRCRKFEDKMLGPFKVISVGSNNRYCKLKLPVTGSEVKNRNKRRTYYTTVIK